MSQNNYIQIKEQSLKGNITEKLFPYLFTYYSTICQNPLVKDSKHFTDYFIKYLNTPVYIGNNIIQPVNDLMRKLPKIFEFLDKQYKETPTS